MADSDYSWQTRSTSSEQCWPPEDLGVVGSFRCLALTLGTATRRLGRGLAQVPPALLVVVGTALLLRIALSLAYSPTYATSFDTNLYLDVAGGELFSDPTRPIGYPLFLRALHTLSDSVAFTIQVQHLLGIACGLLLYATVRRLGAPVWAAVVATAAVLLPLDQIFLEHILMAEAPFELAVFAALYCAVRGLDPSRPTRLRIGSRALWIAGAASLLALAAWLRTTSLPLIPLFALLVRVRPRRAAHAPPRPWRRVHRRGSRRTARLHGAERLLHGEFRDRQRFGVGALRARRALCGLLAVRPAGRDRGALRDDAARRAARSGLLRLAARLPRNPDVYGR